MFAAFSIAVMGVFSSLVYFLYARYTRDIELRGEVFIVTGGAQNIKLGLVEVTAIPEETIQSFVEKKLAAINLEFSKYQSLEQASTVQVQNAKRAYDAAKIQYDLLNDQLEAARRAAEKAQEDAATSVAYAGYSSPEEEKAYQTALNKAETLKRRADQLEVQRDIPLALIWTRSKQVYLLRDPNPVSS